MIINCPNCGNKISDKAKKCPHCEFAFNENIELANNAKMENYEDLDVERVETLIKNFEKEYPELTKVQKNSTYRLYAVIGLYVAMVILLVANIINFISYLNSSGSVVMLILLPLLFVLSLIGVVVLTKIQKKSTYGLIKLDKYFEFWLKEKGIYYSSDFNSGEDKKIYERIVVELKKEKL